MLRFIRASFALAMLCVCSPAVRAQAIVTTGFEDFAPGDVNGQQGWGYLPNSPTGGTIVPAPAGSPAGFGAQSLAVILRSAANLGVANNLFSATIDPPAGENGSTLGGVVVPDPRTTFRASFWYRTPSTPIISTHATAPGRFAELDASSKGTAPGDAANRYAVVRLANTTNTPAGLVRVDMVWFVTSATGMTRTVATLNWGTWYRFEYLIQLVDGMDGANANDRFTLTISDVNGTQLGTACGSTWEAGYKTGGFGGGPTARAVNGFDFWAVTQPNNIVVGHIDQFTMTAEDPAPLAVSPTAGAMNVCGGATTTLTANASGGVGAIAYTWRNASNEIIGTGPTVNVGAGTYTIAVSDALCATATGSITITSNCTTPVVTWNAPAPIVYGTPLSATQLNATANVAGTFTYTPPAGTILGAGTHTLSTDFAPADSANYNPVNGTTVQLTVAQRTTSIYIETVAPSPSRAGEPVTVSFVLNGTFGTPGGTITVTDGVDSCSAAATAHSCMLTLTTPGLRSLTATYSGDANHRGSTSAARLQRVEDDAATARVEGSTTICPGGSAVIRVRFTGTAPWTIRWSDGVTETTSSSLHTRRVTPLESTTYRLTSFRDAVGPGDESGFARISVNVVPAPAIVRDGTTLRASSGYESYQWFRDGAAAGSGPELRIDPQIRATYTVIGSREGCTSAQSAPLIVTPPAPPPPVAQDAVIPVIGNTPGANGSRFRTTLQLVNATSEPLTGQVTFTSELPPFAYALAPRETRFIDNLLPASFSGLTSANVIPSRGPLPIVLAHVFNDVRGTSGMIERAIPLAETLTPGAVVTLLTPIDPQATRFNLGLRSLADGLTVRMTRRAADGRVLATTTRVVPPSTLIHEPLVSGSSDALTFEVLAGAGVIYGAATDNGTNDPNLQIATRAASGRFVLPVAGAVDGAFGSRFATGLQLHNPSDEAQNVTLTFGARSMQVAIAPRSTFASNDVIAFLGATGIGSLDIASSAPIAGVARIYSIAPAGEASLMTELVPVGRALQRGETGVLVAPHAPREMRFNIGWRTLDAGANLTVIIRSAAGAIIRAMNLTLTPNAFAQSEASALLGVPLTGDESIAFAVDEGSAIVYGTWTDNITQDPALQYAVR